MSQKHDFITELKMETASTRKILERVPVEKNDWKPHEKSMKLGNLAAHVAELPGWIAMTMVTDEFDVSTMNYKPNISQSTKELLAVLDENVNKALSALENSTDEDLEKMWTLRNGEHIIFAMPRKAVLRSSSLSHQYHHRAQLGVYLRLLDIPVPGIYGPSYDDMNAPVTAEALAN